MPRKTYLELVNEAIAESKVTLDPLTVANFATPPRTVMYNHFKTWVNRGYKSILVDRNEWFFRQERTTVTIFPRLQIKGASLDANVGDIFEGNSSGVVFSIVQVHASEDVESDPVPEFTVSVDFTVDDQDADNLILNETISRVSPVPTLDIGYIKGRGRYSFEELVPSVDEVDERSFYIQPSVLYTPNISSNDLKVAPYLEYYPWERWKSYYESFNTPTGVPVAVTRTDDGLYDFYPRPNSAFDLSFDYSQHPQLMVLATDVPSLIPEKFEDIIIWKAVSEYADFDERPRVFSRAKKNIDRFTYLLGRDSLPEPKVDIYRFDC